MIVKALCALLVGASVVACQPQQAAAFVQEPAPSPAAIPKVLCPVMGGYSAGSAFHVGPTLLLSVAHVTRFGNCMIDGRPIKVEYTSPDSDFSIISDSLPGPSFRIDCNGYVKDRKYLAIGHARGLDELTTVELTATGKSIGGFYLLKGIFTVIPGQSGGPVMDEETGAVVGTINTYDMTSGISGSVELKGESVCSAT